MNIPTLEEIKAGIEVLITWGIWFVIYVIITLAILSIILVAINVIENRPVKFIK
jgi:hypothetical protein